MNLSNYRSTLLDFSITKSAGIFEVPNETVDMIMNDIRAHVAYKWYQEIYSLINIVKGSESRLKENKLIYEKIRSQEIYTSKNIKIEQTSVLPEFVWEINNDVLYVKFLPKDNSNAFSIECDYNDFLNYINSDISNDSIEFDKILICIRELSAILKKWLDGGYLSDDDFMFIDKETKSKLSRSIKVISIGSRNVFSKLGYDKFSKRYQIDLNKSKYKDIIRKMEMKALNTIKDNSIKNKLEDQLGEGLPTEEIIVYLYFNASIGGKQNETSTFTSGTANLREVNLRVNLPDNLVDLSDLNIFYSTLERLKKSLRHELMHNQQFMLKKFLNTSPVFRFINKNKLLKDKDPSSYIDVTPNIYNSEVEGLKTTDFGYSGLKNPEFILDENDKHKREIHPLRDIEFYPNLVTELGMLAPILKKSKLSKRKHMFALYVGAINDKKYKSITNSENNDINTSHRFEALKIFSIDKWKKAVKICYDYLNSRGYFD